jgi:hypothetical protein
MSDDFEPWITEPGVYDLPVWQYHLDPVVGGSLSNSGAKKLMPPSCPALYRAWRDGGEETSDAFDFGRAAHREVLGAGDAIEIIRGTGKDENSWRTDADKAAVAAARAAGRTPIRPRDAEQVAAMAEALRDHPVAAALLHPDYGRAEQTIVWRDPASGVMCRALLDYLPDSATGQRLVIPDYKTAEKVDPKSISRALWDFAYYGQAAWYREGVERLGLSDGAPAFVLIFQMKTAPYLVVCAQPDPDAIGWGDARNRKARDLFAVCSASGHWPGYADDHVISVQLPQYAINELEAAQTLGHFELEGAPL